MDGRVATALCALVVACTSNAMSVRPTQSPSGVASQTPSAAVPTTPRTTIDEVVTACPSQFHTPEPLHSWWFDTTCTKDDATTVKVTIVRMEHDADGQIVSTLVEDLYLTLGTVDPANIGVEEKPEQAYWVVVNAKAGRTFRHVHWKNEKKFEEERAQLELPFSDEKHARAFAKAVAGAAP
jgi:hypothetical protein